MVAASCAGAVSAAISLSRRPHFCARCPAYHYVGECPSPAPSISRRLTCLSPRRLHIVSPALRRAASRPSIASLPILVASLPFFAASPALRLNTRCMPLVTPPAGVSAFCPATFRVASPAYCLAHRLAAFSLLTGSLLCMYPHPNSTCLRLPPRRCSLVHRLACLSFHCPWLPLFAHRFPCHTILRSSLISPRVGAILPAPACRLAAVPPCCLARPLARRLSPVALTLPRCLATHRSSPRSPAALLAPRLPRLSTVLYARRLVDPPSRAAAVSCGCCTVRPSSRIATISYGHHLVWPPSRMAAVSYGCRLVWPLYRTPGPPSRMATVL